MDKELIDEATFRKIVTTQSAILAELESSDACLEEFIELSNKHYAQAEEAFKGATSTIQRIRSNFDAIYKNLKSLKAKRKQLQEKKQSQDKQNQVEIQFVFSPTTSLKEESTTDMSTLQIAPKPIEDSQTEKLEFKQNNPEGQMVHSADKSNETTPPVLSSHSEEIASDWQKPQQAPTNN